MLEMNIETLLQAAEYIERRERGKSYGGYNGAVSFVPSQLQSGRTSHVN